MIKHLLGLIVLVVTGCGSSDSDSGASSVTLSKENLTGHWKLSKVISDGKEYAMKGTAITQYKSDGSFVNGSQQYYAEGNEAAACWYAASGKYEIKDSTLTETIEKEVGPKGCAEGNFNPQSYTTTLTATSLSNKATNGTEYVFEKISSHSELDYATLVEKFEKVSLTTDDSDKPSGFDMSYRNSRQAGWTTLCPRFSGSQSSGFTLAPTFTYKTNTYDTFLQWDENVITPIGYNSSTPGFTFEKRNASSSDAAGVIGTGRYACSSTSDCASKCNLKVVFTPKSGPNS